MRNLFTTLLFCFFSTAAVAANSSFATVDFNGNNFDLAKQKGKITIINFWAKWCGDCRREMPALDELYKQYHAQGLDIIAVSTDPKTQIDDVKTLAKRYSYPNSMLADATQNDFPSPRRLPTNYIIFDGKVVSVLDDSKTLKSDFEAVILPIMKMNLAR